MSGSSSVPSGPKRQYILHHGCEIGAYFVWEDAESYRVKRFSFELPRPSFFDQHSRFYVHCAIHPCNFYKQREGLPRCWNQRYICQLPKARTSVMVRAGPFTARDSPFYGAGGGDSRGDGIPLWGAGVIAFFAFVLGVVFASVLWLMHFLTRRRHRQPGGGEAGGGGGGRAGEDREKRRLLPTSAAHGRPPPPGAVNGGLRVPPAAFKTSGGANPASFVGRLWRSLRRLRSQRGRLLTSPRHSPIATTASAGAALTNGALANGVCGREHSPAFHMSAVDTASEGYAA